MLYGVCLFQTGIYRAMERRKKCPQTFESPVIMFLMWSFLIRTSCNRACSVVIAQIDWYMATDQSPINVSSTTRVKFSSTCAGSVGHIRNLYYLINIGFLYVLLLDGTYCIELLNKSENNCPHNKSHNTMKNNNNK